MALVLQQIACALSGSAELAQDAGGGIRTGLGAVRERLEAVEGVVDGALRDHPVDPERGSRCVEITDAACGQSDLGEGLTVVTICSLLETTDGACGQSDLVCQGTEYAKAAEEDWQTASARTQAAL